MPAPAGMPASANLTDAQIGDIAEFLHSFPINSRDPARIRPPTIVTGDAAIGPGLFPGQLQRLPFRDRRSERRWRPNIADPRTLQGRFLSPAADRCR